MVSVASGQSECKECERRVPISRKTDMALAKVIKSSVQVANKFKNAIEMASQVGSTHTIVKLFLFCHYVCYSRFKIINVSFLFVE